MLGKRIEYNANAVANPGEYCQHEGVWYACTPNGLLANLSGHTVTEHEDGTISVDPSILCKRAELVWHGHLKNGIWKESQ